MAVVSMRLEKTILAPILCLAALLGPAIAGSLFPFCIAAAAVAAPFGAEEEDAKEGSKTESVVSAANSIPRHREVARRPAAKHSRLRSEHAPQSHVKAPAPFRKIVNPPLCC
jgi:hypothetical protein